MTNNNFSYTGTTSSSINTASSFLLNPRWNYITIIATGATGIWARTDGNAAVESGNDDLSVWVGPGEDVLIANMLPLWTQASNCIAFGTTPGVGQSLYGSLGNANDSTSLGYAGGSLNPGTSVSVISTVASMPFTIMAAG